jgi:hypothetical protein
MRSRTSDARPTPGERGFALVFVTMGLAVIMFLCATSIDLGLGWVARARLNKAVDAAALGAVKFAATVSGASTDEIVDTMRAKAQIVGEANLPNSTFDTIVTTDGDDVTTVRVEGHHTLSTIFGRFLGITTLSVASAAEVTRYPLDLSLVLDVSYSMVRSNSFETMVDAAKTFVSLFDEERDQVGIVAFGMAAFEVYPIQKGFKTVSPAATALDTLVPYPDTNMMQGIQLGHTQLLAAPQRGSGTGARRVVLVLFTDGLPNAFTGTLENFTQPECPAATPPSSFTGVLAAYATDAADGSSPVRALAEPQLQGNTRRITCLSVNAGGGTDVAYTEELRPPPYSPMPALLPNGDPVDGVHVRAYSRTLTIDEARAARAHHVNIFVVGLGNPAGASYDVPDESLLRQIANQSGIDDPNQTQGQEFFAPDKSALKQMFQQVAARILTRVTM